MFRDPADKPEPSINQTRSAEATLGGTFTESLQLATNYWKPVPGNHSPNQRKQYARVRKVFTNTDFPGTQH
jgi:hypothetical protein